MEAGYTRPGNGNGNKVVVLYLSMQRESVRLICYPGIHVLIGEYKAPIHNRLST